MKTIYYLVFLQFCGVVLNAQSASEILKYGLARPYGTARVTAIGGASGALGGEFTAIAINPAGIGFFRKSDFYVSFSTTFDEQQSTLCESNPSGVNNKTYNQTHDDSGLTGIGIVFTSSPWASKWKNSSFAINLIKTADFNKSYYFKGRSPGSITDRFLELALDPDESGLIGLHPDQLDDFEAGLAYETGAIFDVDNNPATYTYNTDLLSHKNYLLPKEQILNTSGGLYNLSFGIGSNYDEKFAIGAAIDIPIGSFNSESRYSEYEAKANDAFPFRNLEFNQTLNTQLSGITARLGVILKPDPFWRLGISVQLPTYMWMKDQFSTSLNYTYNNGSRDTSFTAYSPDGEFTYRLILPMRAVFSAAYVSRHGFISADLDVFDLSKAKYNLTADSDALGDYDYQETVNADIKKQFNAAVQLHLGGELALSNFRIRSGFEVLKQAYSNSDKYDSGFSLGLGYRGNRFYLDLAYRYTTAEQAYSPYITGNSDFDGNGSNDAPTPLVNQKSNQDFIQITLGFKL